MARQLLRRISGDIDEALVKKPNEFTFIDPPLIDAPFTQITKLDGSPRQLPDPSLTLKPVIGVERVVFKEVSRVDDEKGSEGQNIYGIQNDPRVRFIQDITVVPVFGGSPIGLGISMQSGREDGLEVTFFGTGFNLLFGIGTAGTRGYAVEIDGSPISDIISPQSNIISNRSYRANHIVNAVSGLTLGVHTILLTILPNGSLPINGFEILNEDTQIQVPQGDLFSGGRKYTNSALTALDFNTGFDESPTLNGRGGRVIEYITQTGTLGKAIQQTNASAAFIGSSDHTNEEVIRKINFREFGANRADDFSTMSGTGAVDRAFTLDDGTISLSTDSGLISGTGNTLALSNPPTTNFMYFTFVGTGLDIDVRNDTDSGVPDTWEVSVDGSTPVEIINSTLFPAGELRTDGKIIKVASGLPYGTHVVRFENTANIGSNPGIEHFITYGPKKPTVPSGAVELQEYYLMADFVANTVADITTMSTGVLRKEASRELVYTEGTGGTFDWTINNGPQFVGGRQLVTDRLNSKVQYTFFGTGLDLRFESGTSNSSDISVTLNGTPATAANFPGATFTTYGTATYNTGTGSLNQDTVFSRVDGFTISGLPLTKYTVEFNNNVSGGIVRLESLDIVTPVHFPNTKAGSLSLGPGVQLNKETISGGVDLSNAKAWLHIDGTTDTIFASHNVSHIVHPGTGDFFIYFDKPFKIGDAYVGVTVTNSAISNGSNVDMVTVDAHRSRLNSRNGAGALVDMPNIYAVWFGELADEDEE